MITNKIRIYESVFAKLRLRFVYSYQIRNQAMNTFFGIIQNNAAILNEDESLHCVKVLRHKIGDVIRVIDGKGTMAEGTIQAAHAKQCAVLLTKKETVGKTRNYNLHIAIAPTKNMERIEWFVEKAVEIGVDEISFIKCKNSERTVVKDERILKVAESAVKQSQQAYIPKLNSLIEFKEFLKSSGSDIKLIAHCEKDVKENIKKYISTDKTYTILIGPEGDFTKDEITLALSSAYHPS